MHPAMKNLYDNMISSLRVLPVLTENTSEIFYLKNVHFETSAIASLPQFHEWIISASLITSVVIGSYCNCSIYQYMVEKYKNKSQTAIDILILVSTITQHLISLFLTIILTAGISFDITYSHYVGEQGCELIWYSTIYCGAYRTFGSLGIAIFRVLLMKASQWIHKFDQKRVAYFILLLSIATSVCITIGFGTGNGPASRKRAVWNWCKGKSENMREVLDNYALISGTVADESEIFVKITLMGLHIGNFAELGCYVVFFLHFYLHDKGLMGKKIIKEPEFRRRRQKNCMGFMAQFYGFIVECVTYVCMGLALSKNSDIAIRVVITFAFWIEFGINSLVVVFSSENLIENLPHNRYFK